MPPKKGTKTEDTPHPEHEIQEDSVDDLSIGQERVRYTFNPDGNERVDKIKYETAKLINFCELMKAKQPRLVALAQTAYEEAAMWAVKAATG